MDINKLLIPEQGSVSYSGSGSSQPSGSGSSQPSGPSNTQSSYNIMREIIDKLEYQNNVRGNHRYDKYS